MPPLADLNIVPIKLEYLQPAAFEWKMRIQTDMYWDLGQCAASPANEALCADRLATWWFMQAADTKNPDAETTNAAYTTEGLFLDLYPNGGCMKADFLDVSLSEASKTSNSRVYVAPSLSVASPCAAVLGHNFNPKNFPFEVYEVCSCCPPNITSNA